MNFMSEAILSKKSPWQSALISAVTEPKELLEMLGLSMSLLEQAEVATKLFPLKVPKSFIARMQKNDINDPLLRQVLPLGIEKELDPAYSKDPLQEKNANPIPGLLHKYPGRVLLTPTSVCGINCRYCFRRHFPYDENNPGSKGWDLALNYIKNDTSIHEVILSGGDPLVLTEHRLYDFSEKLSQIPQIQRLRIHSRMPIVLPERISAEFIDWISQLKWPLILVVHCNHPNEINQEVIHAMQLLRKTGVILLNQSVLLKGVNDQAETLVALSEKLCQAGIQPYYLHLLDKVEGAKHFDIELENAKSLHSQITQQLPGYLVPKLAYEKAGALSKIILAN